MILAILVLLGFAGVIVAALRLNLHVAQAHRRFRVLVGGYGDAGLLAEARRRFRERQQRVEQLLDTGTTGLESAHGRLSQAFGHPEHKGSAVYSTVRALNRGVGRALSGWLAPKPRKHSESLDEWRQSRNERE